MKAIFVPDEGYIVVPEDYGNHSCLDCQTLPACPISQKVSSKYGIDVPNTCSYYWPPMGTKEPSDWYWKELHQIASEH